MTSVKTIRVTFLVDTVERTVFVYTAVGGDLMRYESD
jgi:hypothetical protein